MVFFEDSIIEPEDGLVRYSPEVVENVRKEFDFHKKENRESAIAVVQQWVKNQDHFLKKDFCKGYIERCLITCKCSVERAKKQIDTICTMRTLMPKYFQITNVKNSEITRFINKNIHFALMPNLTKEYYRVAVLKIRPNADFIHGDTVVLLKFLAIVAEYLKSNDCARGYYLICDNYDSNAAEVLSRVNLMEVQQFVPLMTEGYGCRIKGIMLVTASKFIETFIRLIKPLFSQKIGSRIHAVSSRKKIQDHIPLDVLPADYDGKNKSLEQLHENFIESVSSPRIQNLLKEMNKAATDESKRKIDKFNDQYMGMPGSFRTLSLD